jgi:hypothetical protein
LFNKTDTWTQGFVGSSEEEIKGRDRSDPVERTLLSKIFRGPFREYTWSIETSSFPSGSDSSLLFHPALSHDIHRKNKL